MDFPRINPDHPLAVAARDTNAYAEEHGLEPALEWLGIGASAGEIAYLAEQRALRAVAVDRLGHNMTGASSILDEHIARTIRQTEAWAAMRMLLISCYMDGIAIGWRGAQIDERRAA